MRSACTDAGFGFRRSIDDEAEMLVFRTSSRTGEAYLDPRVIVGIVELRGGGTTLYLSGGQTMGVDATALMIRNAMKQAVTKPDEDIQVKTPR